MSKGIVAFMVVVSLSLSLSVLSGIGFYEELGVRYSDDVASDTQRAADAMIGQDAADKSGGSVIEDFTTSAGRTLSTGWQVIANLSGIVKLLFGAPDPLASGLQTFWQMSFGVTFAAFIRGVVLQ